ncbi:MAG: hypothetical protein AAF939_10805 [Planctomycetota bacterium]
MDFILDYELENEGELARFVLSSVKRELSYARPRFAFLKKLVTFVLGGLATGLTALLIPLYPTLFYDIYGAWSVEVVEEVTKDVSGWKKYTLIIKNESGSVKSGFKIEPISDRYEFKSLERKVSKIEAGEMAKIDFFAKPFGSKTKELCDDISVSIDLTVSDEESKLKKIRLWSGTR